MGYNTTNPDADPHTYVIMGRIHVNTPDDEALMHAMKSLRDPANMDRRLLFYFAARCLTAHHRNAGQYIRVMGATI